MTLHVAVDFGTSSTCVAVSVDGREPQVVVVDGQPLLSSAVFVAADGTLFVGQEAERHAAVDPARYEPHAKRRIDEAELLLGNTVLPVLDVVRAVLSRAVDEARRLAGGVPVDLLVLTHPADWGAIRTRVLRRAGHGLGHELALVPEPVAAAVFHSASHALPDGSALAVLDLGGGTVDASVVRRAGAGFRVLATKGDPHFGGADVDQLLLEYVGSLVAREEPAAWRQLVDGRELTDRRRRRVLRQDVRGAKETLSRHTYTDIPMPPPFPDAYVTRAALERLIVGPLGRAAELTRSTIIESGLTPQQLAAVFLVGGSSRIPMVARLIFEGVGITPTTLDQPETVVARGALRAVSLDPDRTGSLPGLRPGTPVFAYQHDPWPDGPATPPAGIPAAGPVAGQRAAPGPGAVSGHTGQPGSWGPYPAPHPHPGPAQGIPSAPPSGRSGRSGARWLVGGAVALALAVITVLVVNTAGRPPATSNRAPAGKEVAQYDYQFTAPADWVQTGGDAATRKVQLMPRDGLSGQNLLAVDERRLTYDASVERDRAVSELRVLVEQGGSAFSGYEPRVGFGGRDVVHYRQQLSGATVDWYVVFQQKTQISLGCQYTDTGRDQVRASCEQVMRTLSIAG